MKLFTMERSLALVLFASSCVSLVSVYKNYNAKKRWDARVAVVDGMMAEVKEAGDMMDKMLIAARSEGRRDIINYIAEDRLHIGPLQIPDGGSVSNCIFLYYGDEGPVAMMQVVGAGVRVSHCYTAAMDGDVSLKNDHLEKKGDQDVLSPLTVRSLETARVMASVVKR